MLGAARHPALGDQAVRDEIHEKSNADGEGPQPSGFDMVRQPHSDEGHLVDDHETDATDGTGLQDYSQ